MNSVLTILVGRLQSTLFLSKTGTARIANYPARQKVCFGEGISRCRDERLCNIRFGLDCAKY